MAATTVPPLPSAPPHSSTSVIQQSPRSPILAPSPLVVVTPLGSAAGFIPPLPHEFQSDFLV